MMQYPLSSPSFSMDFLTPSPLPWSGAGVSAFRKWSGPMEDVPGVAHGTYPVIQFTREATLYVPRPMRWTNAAAVPRPHPDMQPHRMFRGVPLTPSPSMTTLVDLDRSGSHASPPTSPDGQALGAPSELIVQGAAEAPAPKPSTSPSTSPKKGLGVSRRRLMFKMHGTPNPWTLQDPASSPSANPGADDKIASCAHCSTRHTPLWRRIRSGDSEGVSIVCNACGIYFRTHGRKRPSGLDAVPKKQAPAPAPASAAL